MLQSLDIFTLGICSILASTAFGTVFIALWSRRRSERHLLHWGASNWLYAVVLLALYGLPPSASILRIGVFALMGVSDVLIVSGIYRLDDEHPLRPWMAIPIFSTTAGHAIPLIVSASPAFADVCEAIGLSLAMTICGGATLRQPPGLVKSRGRLIAGLAQLFYLPAYLTIIVVRLWYPDFIALLPRLPMLSDQLLLGVLNLGLLAIPNERAHQRLREQASRDALTGIWNRSGLALLGPKLIKRGGAVVAIDIDHFKSVNDTYGHTAGDKALIAVATIAARIAEAGGGQVFRTGGDEFILILPTCTPNDATELADRLRQVMGSNRDTPMWTLSIGVALIEDAAAQLEDAIRRADVALYEAKALGRDRCEIATI